jgi:APA family basic amino acid/polyamine antiporter
MHNGGNHPATSLHRVLGMTEVTAGGVGIIIGAGIYVLLGAATAHAGPLVWAAFLMAAVLSALTGLSYAELSSMFPSAAGEYEYTRQALPEWVAFIVGWTMITGLVVAAATVSIGFARYIGYFVDIDPRATALGLLVAVCVVAMIGVKQSARLTVGLSAVQVGGLLLVVAIGLPHVGDVDLRTGPGVGGVLTAAALVFFAFIGFDEVITLAEEIRDPTRTVPRALLLALGLSTALYVAVAVAAVSVLGAGALAASPRPLADVMAHVLGGRGATVVAAIAVMTTTNTTLLALTAASRVMYGMAKAGAMPRALAAVHPVRGTPVRAIIAVASVAAVFAALGEFAVIAAVTDFAVYVVFLAVNGTVVILRRTRPDHPRPFAVAGAIRAFRWCRSSDSRQWLS